MRYLLSIKKEMSFLKISLIVCVIICCGVCNGQSVKILGRVVSELDVENIHVMNKTSQIFAITNASGNFEITGKQNDTLVFSSVQHNPKVVVVSNKIVLNKVIYVVLETHVNELEEVVLGKVLTGNLLQDIVSVKGKAPINFYDVGIPGYTGKVATQSERLLSEASGLSAKAGGSLGGLGGSIGFTPIINAITGRTKKLKARVELDVREVLIQHIKSTLAKDFFISNPLDDDSKMDFFYFCADDDNFITYCKEKNDFKILAFLRVKYRQYLKNQEKTTF